MFRPHLLLFCLIVQSGICAVSHSVRADPGLANPSEVEGFVLWPRGEVFAPLIADPKGVRSFASYLSTHSGPMAGTMTAVAVGDDFGFWRWTERNRDLRLQLGVEAGVFSQFHLEGQGLQLISSDYVVGVPLTLQWRRHAVRLRLYHQSSHLGDDVLFRRISRGSSFAFEALEVLFSRSQRWSRLYAGGEALFHRKPTDLGSGLIHLGGELWSAELASLRRYLGTCHVVGGIDFKLLRRESWTGATSGRIGLELRASTMTRFPSRLALLFEFYRGWSHYGQFYSERLSYTGLGLHFSH